MVLSPLLIYHTQKFNVLRPDLEAKAKAAHRQGQDQGRGSSRPRPQNFVLEVEASPRGPHPWKRVLRNIKGLVMERVSQTVSQTNSSLGKHCKLIQLGPGPKTIFVHYVRLTVLRNTLGRRLARICHNRTTTIPYTSSPKQLIC